MLNINVCCASMSKFEASSRDAAVWSEPATLTGVPPIKAIPATGPTHD